LEHDNIQLNTQLNESKEINKLQTTKSIQLAEIKITRLKN